MRRNRAPLPSVPVFGNDSAPASAGAFSFPPEADASAVAKMDGFDDLPREFRHVLNYGANTVETEMREFADAVRDHPHLTMTYLRRLQMALAAPTDRFIDGRLQNR